MFKNVKVSDKKEYDKIDRYMLSQEVEKDSVRKEISLVGICFDKEKGKNIKIGDNIYIVAKPKINKFNRKKKYKSWNSRYRKNLKSERREYGKL